MNRRSAVTTSITQAIGGAVLAKAPRASEAAAMAKARTSVFLGKRTVFGDGVAASVGRLPDLGSGELGGLSGLSFQAHRLLS
jgi:hypothetical protein